MTLFRGVKTTMERLFKKNVRLEKTDQKNIEVQTNKT